MSTISAPLDIPTAAASLKPTSTSLVKSALSASSFIYSPRSWVSTLARSSILSYLEDGITVGSLEIVEPDGQVHLFGTKTQGGNNVSLQVTNDHFWSALFLNGDLGFAESFMVGHIQTTSLAAVFHLWMDNETSMTGMSSLFNRLSAAISGLSNAFMGQTLAQSRLNAMMAYDQSNELFMSFLSKEMMYSCALWGEEEGGVRGDVLGIAKAGDLEAAQRRKLHHILRTARVKPGDRVLEFGTGWGALAITAARDFGCEVDTLTLAKEQKALAEERIREAGLEGRIRVHLMDYRDLPAEFEKAFDAFVSIEMIEHVGTKHYEKYFQIVDWALKSSNATAVVTSSTFPECRYTTYQQVDFVRRYMWPQGALPSASVIVNAANAACQGRMSLDSVENHSAHYARTLRTWGVNMKENLTPELLGMQALPTCDAAYERDHDYNAMVRKWEYLFAYASTGFARGYISCHMWSWIRANDCPEPCA